MTTTDTQPTTAHPPPPNVDTATAPTWAWLLVLVPTCLIVATVVVGLTSVLLDLYATWSVVAIAVAATLAATPTLVGLARRRGEGADRRAHVWAAVAVLAVVAIGGWSARHLGEHVVVFRDPGVYLNAGQWLAAHDDLRVEVQPSSLDVIDERITGGPGVYEVGDGRLEFQFAHGTAVVLAVTADLAGHDAMLLATLGVGLLGLLALYLAVVEFARSRPAAVAVTVAFGISLPFAFVTRNTYSEPYVLLLVTVGMAVFACRRRPTASEMVSAGVAIGATLMFRADAVLILLGLVGVAFMLVFGGAPRREAFAMLGAAAAIAVVGWLDMTRLSGPYFGGQVEHQPLLAAVGIVGMMTVWAAPAIANWFEQRRGGLAAPSPVAIGAGAVVSGALLAAWLVRPRWFEATGYWSDDQRLADAVRSVQAMNGLPIDGTRSYAEYTVAQVGWYFGPILLAAAVAGAGLFVWRALRELTSPMARWLPFWIPTVPIYLVDHRITPDHLWATRRFVPTVLPMLFVFAAVAVAYAGAAVLRRVPADAAEPVRRVGLVGVALAFVAPTALATAPIRAHADQRGYGDALDEVCREVEGRTVLSLDAPQFVTALRTRCGVEIAALPDGADPADADPFVTAARAACEPAALISISPDRLDRFRDELEASVVVVAENGFVAEQTLDRRPSTYAGQSWTFAVGRLARPAGC